MKRFYFVLIPLFFLFSCTTKEEPEKIVVKPESKTYPKVVLKEVPSVPESTQTESVIVTITIEKHFTDWTDSTLMSAGTTLLEMSGLLKPFYESRAYHLVWWNGTNADSVDAKRLVCVQQLLDMLKQANFYGLDSSWYHLNKVQEVLESLMELDSGQYDFELIANLDLLMTNAYFQFATHLNQGVTDSVSAYGLERNRLAIDLPEYLSEALDKKEVLKSLLDVQPKSHGYVRLQQSLEKFLNDFQVNDIKQVLPDPKEYEDSCRTEAIKVLIGMQYLTDSTAKSKKEVKSAIKKFQREHGLSVDGAIGKNTVAALQMTTRQRYEQIAVNLEKLRWEMPWEKNHLYVNIPKYILHLVQNFETVKTHKVVVGNKKARTPQEINSQVEYLVTFPFWHVPKGIAVKEILPHIKKDSNYLVSRHYELMGRGWKAVDPKTVDWSKMTRSNFPYRIRQMGGPWNAVGLVKFIFPNEHFVYLHDTPAKKYFNTDLRAFSHGCLRLHNPMDFADYLLKVDSNKYTVDSVQAHIDRKNSRKMRFKKPLPIYVRYYTCEGDAEGNVYYFRDVYGLDRKIRKRLFKN